MACTRYVTEVDMPLDLVAHGQKDGRWEAHIASWQFLSTSHRG
jgi:hypothetical protein